MLPNQGQRKKIILITSTQLSLNPRLVKEADALSGAGYDITVLHAYWNKWGAEFDKELVIRKKWKAICIGGDPEQKRAIFFLSRVIYNAALIINRKFSIKVLTDIAITRSSFFLKRAAKKYNADLYIGHNPGALPATVKAAKTNKKLCGFDAEDYHRNELSNDSNHPDVILKTGLEEHYFPQLDYLSTSSPSIASAYKQIFPHIDPVVLLNVFPSVSNIPDPVYNPDKPIRLLWFSQTIGMSRGLEDIVKALELLKDYPFELHLLGYLSEETKTNYIDKLINKNVVRTYFHSPMPSDELPVFASQFDVGLALEPAFSMNNDMALSNKIFTYMQGGLAIAASDTKAQHQLLSEYPHIGKFYQKGNAQALADILLYYHQHREKLFKTREAALEAANNELNWENESKKFLNLIEQTLSCN
jgi:glycosyltransferase involved in cell wall biosynthesis